MFAVTVVIAVAVQVAVQVAVAVVVVVVVVVLVVLLGWAVLLLRWVVQRRGPFQVLLLVVTGGVVEGEGGGGL